MRITRCLLILLLLVMCLPVLSAQSNRETRPVVGLIGSIAPLVQLRDSKTAKPVQLDAVRDRWRPLYDGQQLRCLRKGAEVAIELPTGSTLRITYVSPSRKSTRKPAEVPNEWVSPAALDAVAASQAGQAPSEQARQEQERRFRQQIYTEKTRLGGVERAASDTVLFFPVDGGTVRCEHFAVRWNPFQTYKASVRLQLADAEGRPIGAPLEISSSAGTCGVEGLQQEILAACGKTRQTFQLRLYDGADCVSTVTFSVLSPQESATLSQALAEVDKIGSPADRSLLRAAILRENHLFNEAADEFASMADLPEVAHSPYARFRIYVEQARIGNSALAKRLAESLPAALLLSPR